MLPREQEVQTLAKSSETSAVNSATVPHSPIQEQQIDFLLEEEFACNPSFLTFFLDTAKEDKDAAEAGAEHPLHFEPCGEWHCQTVRSVTTEHGETDVLVVYDSAHPTRPRVAILIEDKIRAGFQNDQAPRYRKRAKLG